MNKMMYAPKLVGRILHVLGLSRLLIASQRSRVTFLMLHGVMEPDSLAVWKPLRTQHAPAQLASVLAVLGKYYHFVSLPDAVSMLSGDKPLLPNSMVLTFDDGYRNNLTHAMPILRQFNAPATIFLSTGNVTEQKPFWFDRLDFAVQAAGNDPAARKRIPEFAEMDFSSRETLARSFVAFIQKEKKRYPTDVLMRKAMEGLSDRLEQYSGKGLADIFTTDPWAGVLTWDEIRQAAGEVHFGSHGVDHPLLGLASPDTVRRELIASRESIEFSTDRTCEHLAYPGGSFNTEVVSLAKKCGYVSAVTTVAGLNRLGCDPLTLKRIAFPRTELQAGIIAAVTGISSQWKRFAKK